MSTLPDRNPATKVLSSSTSLLSSAHAAAHLAAQRKAGYIPRSNVAVKPSLPTSAGNQSTSTSTTGMKSQTFPSNSSNGGSGSTGVSNKTSSSTASSSSISSSQEKALLSKENLWDLDLETTKLWIHSIHTLFPTKSNHGNEDEKIKHMKEVDTVNHIVENLLVGVRSACETDESDSSSPKHEAKRIKLDSSGTTTTTTKTTNESERDVYRILDSSFSKGKDVVHRPGALLSRLTKAGLANAFSGRKGGVIDPNTGECINNAKKDEPITTARDLTLTQIQTYVEVMKTSIDARLELDMLKSTPSRIVEILCPEVTMSDIQSIRRRIYDTVVLGRGTNSGVLAAESAGNLPVAARTAQHDIDKFKKCHFCGNNNQSSFVLDKKNGDLICTSCGTVVTESLMHEGSQFRKFEGEVDRNHHGDVANPLYSNAHNMGTTLGGVGWQSGAGLGGYGSGRGTRGLENVLRNAHAYTEMNISQFGKEEKKTRIGYKDKQKKDAFAKITHVGESLNLHQQVLQRAKELFSGFRDDRELVVQFKGVVAACVCEAFDQFCKDGRQILKVKAGEEPAESESSREDIKVVPNKASARAHRRVELHSSSLAGKGGLMLNTDSAKATKPEVGPSENESVVTSEVESKDVSTWSLNDIRSWLREASSNIAKKWYESRDQGNAKNIPDGSVQELEGYLVKKTLLLCTVLENEMKTNTAKGATFNKQRVGTPRVKDMGKLGIKWQHKGERGSGGAGGVGGSGRAMKARCKKTAGQILKIKNSIKLGQAFDDKVAGDAFYKELRALLARQESRKKKATRNESSMQRLNQANRKQYLLARANS